MAVIIGAAIAGTAAVASSVNSSNAAKDAAGTSKKAAASQVAEARRQFDLTRQDNEPWRQAGVGALGRLQNPLASFEASPDYAFRKAQGLEGIAQSKAIGGQLKSGSALADSITFNSNLAAGEWGDWWNRQAGLAGIGQTANAANQQAGQFYAGTVGQANQWNAANQMQSAFTQANAQNQAMGQLGGIFSNVLANYGTTPSYTGSTGTSGYMPRRTG